MPRSPDAVCAGSCGRLLWGGRGSLPPERRMCRPSRRLGLHIGKSRRCLWCADRLVSHQRKFCSPVCSNRHAADARTGGRCVEKRMRYRAKGRRRRTQRLATWDGITDRQIFDRDRWRCGICGQPISRTRRWPDPRAASIDHLVPLSQGGMDTAANKRASHLGCNCARGNRGGNEQLALIG